MNLKSLVASGQVDLGEIRERLDGCSFAECVDQVHALGRAEQRALFRKAGQGPALTLAHFVPPQTPPAQAVHHHGRNTLPLPGKNRFFQKRFCRPEDGSERLFGYNEAPSGWLVGPGFFVVVPTAGKPDWMERGAVVVDYFQVPPADARLPAGWPRLVPNNRGLSRFVYNRTRDFMRGISDRVSIGAAYKGEKSLDHYFVLVREDG